MASANMNLTDSYFFMRREFAIAHLASLGMPQEQITAFLDYKSIAYEDVNMLWNKAQDPNYVNYLRMA